MKNLLVSLITPHEAYSFFSMILGRITSPIDCALPCSSSGVHSFCAILAADQPPVAAQFSSMSKLFLPFLTLTTSNIALTG